MEDLNEVFMTISKADEIACVKHLIKSSLLILRDKDIELIKSEVRFSNNDTEQKLHEVCINHRLAVYIEKNLNDENYFVDIEYNKNNYAPKILQTDNCQKEVRPDIIVHTRTKDTNYHKSYLIIESKKDKDSEKDEEKIKAFIKSTDYSYKFGCKIIYGDLYSKCKIKVFYSLDGKKIDSDEIKLE